MPGVIAANEGFLPVHGAILLCCFDQLWSSNAQPLAKHHVHGLLSDVALWLQDLLKLLALTNPNCGRQDARWNQQTFLALMALHHEIPAAQGLWGAIAGSAEVRRSDWAQAADMIQVHSQG